MFIDDQVVFGEFFRFCNENKIDDNLREKIKSLISYETIDVLKQHNRFLQIERLFQKCGRNMYVFGQKIEEMEKKVNFSKEVSKFCDDNGIDEPLRKKIKDLILDQNITDDEKDARFREIQEIFQKHRSDMSVFGKEIEEMKKKVNLLKKVSKFCDDNGIDENIKITILRLTSDTTIDVFEQYVRFGKIQVILQKHESDMSAFEQKIEEMEKKVNLSKEVSKFCDENVIDRNIKIIILRLTSDTKIDVLEQYARFGRIQVIFQKHEMDMSAFQQKIEQICEKIDLSDEVSKFCDDNKITGLLRKNIKDLILDQNITDDEKYYRFTKVRVLFIGYENDMSNFEKQIIDKLIKFFGADFVDSKYPPINLSDTGTITEDSKYNTAAASR